MFKVVPIEDEVEGIRQSRELKCNCREGYVMYEERDLGIKDW